MSRERRILAVLAACSTSAGAALLYLDSVPGRITSLFFPFPVRMLCCLASPLILLAFLIWLFVRLSHDKAVFPFSLGRAWALLLPFGLAAVIATTNLPVRLRLLASRDALLALVAKAPVSDYQGEPLDCRVGHFHIDRYAAHPQGGVFFRTYTSPNFVDTYSYGLAYHPNPHTTPFGAYGYTLRSLGNGWYAFSASDEWYPDTPPPTPAPTPPPGPPPHSPLQPPLTPSPTPPPTPPTTEPAPSTHPSR